MPLCRPGRENSKFEVRSLKFEVRSLTLSRRFSAGCRYVGCPDHLDERVSWNPRQRKTGARRRTVLRALPVRVVHVVEIHIALLVGGRGGRTGGQRRAVVRAQAEEHLHVQEVAHRAAQTLDRILHVVHREPGVILEVPGVRTGLTFDARAGDPHDAGRPWSRRTRRGALLLRGSSEQRWTTTNRRGGRGHHAADESSPASGIHRVAPLLALSIYLYRAIVRPLASYRTLPSRTVTSHDNRSVPSNTRLD